MHSSSSSLGLDKLFCWENSMYLLLVPCLVLQFFVPEVLAQNETTEEFPDLAKIVTPSLTQNRVVGGEVKTIEEIGGYLVALRYMGEFICGGTVVNTRIVVSAAHCFTHRRIVEYWTVHGGITNMNDTGHRSLLTDFVLPTVFSEGHMHMDVAVLYLQVHMEGPKIRQIPLCSTPLREGMELRVSGWGLPSPDTTLKPGLLRSTVVPVTKRRECKRIYLPVMPLTDSMFCAGALGKRDACVYDSGGPFVLEKGRKQLCGIVSFGIGCASSKYPGVYTNVNYVKQFIIESAARYGIEVQ